RSTISLLSLHDALPIYDSCAGQRIKVCHGIIRQGRTSDAETKVGTVASPFCRRDIGSGPILRQQPTEALEQIRICRTAASRYWQDRKSTRLNSSHVSIS